MQVPVELSRIYIREMADCQIIELSEIGGTRSFPIVIGMTEACAIERRRKGCGVERPQTHDLLSNTIEALGATVDRIEIADLKQTTFFARIFLRRGDKVIELDARPSDAVALAVATNAPMYASEHVLAEASLSVAHADIPPFDESDEDDDADDDQDGGMGDLDAKPSDEGDDLFSEKPDSDDD